MGLGVLMWRRAGLTGFCVFLGACGGAAGSDPPSASGGAGSGSSGSGAGTSGESSAATGGLRATAGGSSGADTAQGGAPFTGNHLGGSAALTGEGGAPLVFPPRECRNSAPHPADGGYVQCGTGEYQRPQVGVCTSKLPRPERIESRIDTECWFDAECSARANGYCAYGTCTYGCVSDDECAAGSICFCRDPVGTCVPAACRSSADCSGGYPCYTVTPSQGFACQRADGACQSSGHCSAGWSCSLPEGTPSYCWPPPG